MVRNPVRTLQELWTIIQRQREDARRSRLVMIQQPPVSVSLKGHVEVETIDMVTGERHWIKRYNTLTDSLRAAVAQALTGIVINAPNYIAVGTGSPDGWDPTNYDTDYTFKSTGADQAFAQSLTPASSYVVNHIHFWMYRLGASAANVTCEIQTDSGGLPSGIDVAGGAPVTIAMNSLALGPFTTGPLGSWVEFDFGSSTPTLVAGTKYHFVVKTSGYVYNAGVLELHIGTDTSAPGYAGGNFETFDGAVWTAHSPAADAIFRTIITVNSAMTGVVGELLRKPITSKTNPSPNQARLLTTFTTSDTPEHWCHVAMFANAVGGAAEAIANIELDKTNQMAVNIYWVIQCN